MRLTLILAAAFLLLGCSVISVNGVRVNSAGTAALAVGAIGAASLQADRHQHPHLARPAAGSPGPGLGPVRGKTIDPPGQSRIPEDGCTACTKGDPELTPF